MSRTDVKTPNPCVLTLEEQIQLLAFLKKFNIKLGTVFLPTAASGMPFGAAGIGPNLQIKATKLDTIQDIQTISQVQFDRLGLGTPPISQGQLKISGFSIFADTFGKISINNPNPPNAYIDYSIGGANTGIAAGAIAVLQAALSYNDYLSQGGAGIVSLHCNATAAKDYGGSLTFCGRTNTSSTNAPLFAGIIGAKENTTNGDTKAYFAILINNGSFPYPERMRISSGGNLGLDTINPTKRFSIAEKLQIDNNGLPVKSNNIGLAGQGFPLIVAAGNLTGQTGAISSLTSFTTSSAGGSFEIGGYIDVTAFTAGTISLLCDYTDPSGTARTLTIPLIALAGTVSGSVGSLTDASAVISAIQTSGANAIKIYTSVSLFTGTYNAYAWIKQIV